MNSFGLKVKELMLVLSLGVCLAANGSADNSTTNTAHKPVAHPVMRSTHPTTTHSVARKPGTHTTASHTATHRQATSHSGTVHTAARSTASHRSSASAVKHTTSHTTSSASRRTGSHTHTVRSHPTTGQQRLARLHLQPERTQEIQQALIREGYLQGDATGEWDARTHDAMLRYQTAHGFPATGLPEAKSLMKLGLGSHPLPPELDGPPKAGSPAASAAPGDIAVVPASPSVSPYPPPDTRSRPPAKSSRPSHS